jgi:hypothetical protein
MANDTEMLRTLKDILTTLQRMEGHLQTLAGFEQRMLDRQAKVAQKAQAIQDQFDHATRP